MKNRVLSLIDSLELSPHPEGGYYKEVYRSATTVHSPHVGENRNALTDIYFLLLSGQVSRLHRVLHDEIWHFYEGTPLLLVEIEAEGFEMQEVRLESCGPLPRYKHCIRGGNWQAAYSTGEYSLVGCTVAPGFDFADFEFLSENAAQRAIVLEKFPKLRQLI
jgi:predicted cupin superfamily sugar epimerase